ncbi:MAG: cyclase family protein, partial [Clostridia bacterium]|nr:cyclase family protein [Clostridia bacterium]
MKIYDISRPVFDCSTYPGDPVPEATAVLRISEGAECNLSAFSMCAHNGTHVDAPYHFVDDGEPIDGVDLSRFIGTAYVTEHCGPVTEADAKRILMKAGEKRHILVKGDSELTIEAAAVFAEAKIALYGNESMTVGNPETSPTVHRTMLGAGIFFLENTDL